MNSNFMEMQGKLENSQSHVSSQIQSRNEYLMDRVKKLEKQVRDSEQQTFEVEQQNRSLKRDLKN